MKPPAHADAIRLELSGQPVKHLAVAGTIPGVVPLAAAARNGPGVGRLRSLGDGTTIAWHAPRSTTWGAAVDVSAGGTFLLEDGDDVDKWLRVEVFAAHLLPTPVEGTVWLADQTQNAVAGQDVSAGEAETGDAAVWTIDLANDSHVTASRVRAWIDAQTEGLEISDDGLSWVAPVDEASSLALPDVPAGGTVTLHLRRTTAPSAPADPSVLNLLHFSFHGV